MTRRLFRFIALLLLITPLITACGNQAGADTAEFNPMFTAAQAGAIAGQSAQAATDALAEAQKNAGVQSAKRESVTTAARTNSWESVWERLSEKLNANRPGIAANRSTLQADQRSFWDRIYEDYRDMATSSQLYNDKLPAPQ